MPHGEGGMDPTSRQRRPTEPWRPRLPCGIPGEVNRIHKEEETGVFGYVRPRPHPKEGLGSQEAFSKVGAWALAGKSQGLRNVNPI